MMFVPFLVSAFPGSLVMRESLFAFHRSTARNSSACYVESWLRPVKSFRRASVEWEKRTDPPSHSYGRSGIRITHENPDRRPAFAAPRRRRHAHSSFAQGRLCYCSLTSVRSVASILQQVSRSVDRHAV